MTVNFATERPYVVSTNSDTRKGHFYTVEKAVEFAKDERGTRKVYGLHRGHWKLLAMYKNGVRQQIP
jgi:hypothetical protein